MSNFTDKKMESEDFSKEVENFSKFIEDDSISSKENIKYKNIKIHPNDSRQLLIFGSSAKIKMNILNKFNIYPDILISPDIDESRLQKEKPIHMAKRLALHKSIKVLHKFLSQRIDCKEYDEIFILSLDSVVSVGTRVLEKSNNVDELIKNLNLLSGRAHRVYTAFSLLKFKIPEVYSLKNELSINVKIDIEDEPNVFDITNELKGGEIPIQEKQAAIPVHGYDIDLESILEKLISLNKIKPRFQLSKLNDLIRLLKKDIKVVVKHSLTRVEFKRLTKNEIDRYVAVYQNNIDAASAVYQSEDYGLRFIKSINGSLSGLQGLPLYEVINSLESLGFIFE